MAKTPDRMYFGPSVALRRTFVLALLAALMTVAFASSAFAQGLPDSRTHVDQAEGTATPAAADPDSPRLTYLKSDTNARDLRNGYLFVLARCDARCVVEVSATTKISGKQREVASASKTLPANKVRRIRLRIRSDVRRRLANGARFNFSALPLPPA
jgi:hypothetical protein